MPNIDLAVIALDDRAGPGPWPMSCCRGDYPAGVGVPVGDDLGTDDVRWRRWDADRWNGGTFSEKDGSRASTVGWKDDPPLTAADDIVPGREKAPLEFMAPYPASMFKLMVAFHTLRLVDRGAIDLDRPYRYDPPDGPGMTRTTRDLLDRMITESDNDSARALVKQIHDLGQMDALNAGFSEPRPRNAAGERDRPGQRRQLGDRADHDDVARHRPAAAAGQRRTGACCGGRRPARRWGPTSSRPPPGRLFLGLLGDQGWNDILTTANWCGRTVSGGGHPEPGGRPLGRPRHRHRDGDRQGLRAGRAALQRRAEVSFAHKTGFTYNYLADAGIVRSLTGQDGGSYIVVMMSNLGYRYTDRPPGRD